MQLTYTGLPSASRKVQQKLEDREEPDKHIGNENQHITEDERASSFKS
jgi:hypothetical protein